MTDAAQQTARPSIVGAPAEWPTHMVRGAEVISVQIEEEQANKNTTGCAVLIMHGYYSIFTTIARPCVFW